jgi:hypothetical protein
MKMKGINLDNNLKKLGMEIWKNHVYLVNWIKLLNIFGNLDQFDSSVYEEFSGAKDDLIV